MPSESPSDGIGTPDLPPSAETAHGGAAVIGGRARCRAVTLRLRRLLFCTEAARVQIPAGARIGMCGLMVGCTRAPGDGTVLVACPCEFVC
ncbi:hypothetical protein LN384_26360, partial [Enterobacter hormaechei subsp. steigerwaltii]|nr:hypothetical protein [Enterobacter hormaechei subsp. steigerwaltii]